MARPETWYLFVGEKPSNTAFNKGLTWESGKLAARTLFNALDTIGIGRHRCKFMNLFGDTPDDGEHGTDEITTRLARIKSVTGYQIVAMGQKVSKILTAGEVPHVSIFHPAARGKIRKREVYIQHVQDVLAPNAKPPAVRPGVS